MACLGKTLPKVLSSAPGLIQINMTVKKRKQSEVVYTYYPTTTQIFMCKEMFFMRCDYSSCQFFFYYLFLQLLYW